MWLEKTESTKSNIVISALYYKHANNRTNVLTVKKKSIIANIIAIID